MSHHERSSWSSLDLRITPNGHAPVRTVRCALPGEVFFKIKSNHLWIYNSNYFSDPTNIFFMIKIDNFRGDLSDISAKTVTVNVPVRGV